MTLVMPCRLRAQIAALHEDITTPGCVHLLLDRLMALWPAEYYTRTYVFKSLGTRFVDLVVFHGIAVELDPMNAYLVRPHGKWIAHRYPEAVMDILRTMETT
jgi:hypothetical protein